MRRSWMFCGNASVYSMVAAMSVCIAATCSFSACSGDSEEPSPESPTYAESRTVLVYMEAENSLNSKVSSDVAEMLLGMKDNTLYAKDRLVLYVDDVELPRYYVIDKNTEARSLSELTPVLEYTEDVNSSSADQLAEAFLQAKTLCPADSYGLVMWSHASGWVPSSYAGDALSTRNSVSMPRRSFGADNGKNTTSNTGSEMDMMKMARALEKEGGVDFILFDACFMQNLEVAYELRNATKYVISSPAEIPGPGAYYVTMVQALFKRNNFDAEILQAYYDFYTTVDTMYGLVMSSVQTNALPDFAAYMKKVVAAHREELLMTDYSNTFNYRRASWTDYLSPDLYDAQGLMKQVLSADEYTQWKQEVAKVVTCKHASGWYSSFNNRMNPIDDELCCGITMHVPLSRYESSRLKLNEYFLKTAWGKDVWKE